MRRISWLIITLCIVIACAEPTSSRAYFKYVPPQRPQAKRYRVVKIITASISRYVKPRREEFSSERAFRSAVRKNGHGVTYFGTKAREGTVAANLGIKPGQFKRGTLVYIPDTHESGTVDDLCPTAVKLSKKGIVFFDFFTTHMSHKQAWNWGIRPMTVEIREPV